MNLKQSEVAIATSQFISPTDSIKSSEGDDSLLENLGTEQNISADECLALAKMLEHTVANCEPGLRVNSSPSVLVAINCWLVPTRNNTE